METQTLTGRLIYVVWDADTRELEGCYSTREGAQAWIEDLHPDARKYYVILRYRLDAGIEP